MELRNRNRMGNTQNNAAQTRRRSLSQPAQVMRPRNEEPQPVSTSQNSPPEQERIQEPPVLPQVNTSF